MQGNSRVVSSTQQQTHEKLAPTVRRHIENEFLKPVSAHTQAAFDRAAGFIAERKQPVILDSGCGAGEGAIYLAAKYPAHLVIGLDKSQVRLQKAAMKNSPDNMLLLRADQFDFWRLAAAALWRVDAHYLFYPNPWPKKNHLKRRIHGHPSFAAFSSLSAYIEVRSNWAIYLEEMARALEMAAGRTNKIAEISKNEPITLFEKKFMASKQRLFILKSYASGTQQWI